MSVPLSSVANCPYLMDFNNEIKGQASNSVANSEAQVNLATALNQFISQKRWKDYEPTCASVGPPLESIIPSACPVSHVQQNA